MGKAGRPPPRVDRSQAASLLIVKSTPHLNDVVENAVRRIEQSGTPFLRVCQVFITHGHSDHAMRLSALLVTVWEFQRRQPSAIYGPPGTGRLVRDALQLLLRNYEIRRTEGYPTPIVSIVKAGDVGTSAVYSDDNLRLFLVENSHFSLGADSPAEGRFKSYSYRFVTLIKSVAFTGGTGPSAALSSSVGV